MDYLFDVDTTLANLDHRLGFIQRINPDWNSFHDPALVTQDTPYPRMIELIRGLCSHFNTITFVTGRPEALRGVTIKWLRCHIGAVYLAQTEWFLFMRSDGDRRSSVEVKRELLSRVHDLGIRPLIAFEDRASDAAMWRGEGLTCCHVAEGDY